MKAKLFGCSTSYPVTHDAFFLSRGREQALSLALCEHQQCLVNSLPFLLWGLLPHRHSKCIPYRSPIPLGFQLPGPNLRSSLGSSCYLPFGFTVGKHCQTWNNGKVLIAPPISASLSRYPLCLDSISKLCLVYFAWDLFLRQALFIQPRLALLLSKF